MAQSVEGHRTALVADDEPGICEIVQVGLEAGGFEQVLTASSVDEALNIAEGLDQDGLPVDLLVTDNCMPDAGDGFRLIDELKRLPFVSKMRKVVVMSALREETVIEIAKLKSDKGWDIGFLGKPFNFDDLLRLAT